MSDPQAGADLATSIELQLDTLCEGIDEVAGRLKLDRQATLIVCGNFSKKLRVWMEAHYAEIDAIERMR
jgi:hypothetical protein